MSDAGYDSLGSDSEDYTELYKQAPKTEEEKIAEAIRAKQYMLSMAGISDNNNNTSPLSTSLQKTSISSPHVTKPHSPTPSRQSGTSHQNLSPTHRSPSTSTAKPPPSPQKPQLTCTPAPTPPPENSAKKPRTRKHGIGQERQLGLDSGSMDAFNEVGFDACPLVPTQPKGRAPIAHMYDPVPLAAKSAEGGEASIRKFGGMSIEESMVRTAPGGSVPTIDLDVGEDGDGIVKQMGIGPAKDQEARMLLTDAGLCDTLPSEKVGIERKEVQKTSSVEQNEVRSSSAAFTGKGKRHSKNITTKETAPKKSIAAPNSTIKPSTPKKPTPQDTTPRAILKNAGIKLSTKAVTFKPSRSSKKQATTAPIPHAVLKGNRKRALCDIDAGTLFTPSQIGSRSEQERAKRQRRALALHQDVHTSKDAVAATVTQGAAPENGLLEECPVHITNLDHCDSTSERLPDPATDETCADDLSSLFGDAEDDRVTCAAQLAPAAATRALSPTQSVQTITSTPRQQTPEQPTEHVADAPEAPSSPTLRPTIARKTVSCNSLAVSKTTGRYRVTRDEEDDDNDENGESTATGADNEGATSAVERFDQDVHVDSTDQIMYQYLVTRYDFGPNVAEEDAVVTEFGPYYTLSEANESAKEEVGRSYSAMLEATQWIGLPVDLGEARGRGSDIGVAVDEIGRQTWRCVNLGGRGVVTAVRREIKPKRSMQGGSIPASAFTIPRRVYLVLQFLRDPAFTQTRNDGDSLQEEIGIEVLTLGAFTALDLANKKAGFAVLAFSTGHLGAGPLNDIKVKEQTCLMRKRLQELETDDELFDQEVVTREGGVGRVWVVSVLVEGPRN